MYFFTIIPNDLVTLVTVSDKEGRCTPGLNSAWPCVESCDVKVCMKIMLELGTGVKADPLEMCLKGLSSKICLALSGINRQVSLKERGAEIFS